MDKNKKYLSQITKKDLEEIAAAANIYPGPGINIDRNPDGLCISVDIDQLRRWIWCYVRNEGPANSNPMATPIDKIAST